MPRNRRKRQANWHEKEDRDHLEKLEAALQTYENLFAEAVIELTKARGLKLSYNSDVLAFEREPDEPFLTVCSKFDFGGDIYRSCVI